MHVDYTTLIRSTPAAQHWKNVGIKHHHGIAVPLFSLHQNGQAIGTYSDLIPLIAWCKEIGLDVIQLLPLNDTGRDTSPYSAISAFALNPIHLNLQQLPYVDEDYTLQEMLQNHSKAEKNRKHVDYANIHIFNEAFLSRYIATWGSQLREQPLFAKCMQFPWLQGYALYKSILVANDWNGWEIWEQHERQPTPTEYQELLHTYEHDVFYHSAVQYLCWREWKMVRDAADNAGILLKGDIPILINRASADVWQHRSLFNLELCAGAPPDMFSTEGQNWGVPLYRWDEQKASLYSWWQQRLESAALLYHVYRLDHVVGFFRIWAMKPEDRGSQGFYRPSEPERWIPEGEERMQVLIEAASLLPIAEDLGVVPNEVRQCLTELGICGTKVIRWERLWEKPGQPYIDPTTYPPLSLTTVSTHDSELLRQWWTTSPEDAKSLCQMQGWNYQQELSVELIQAILRLSHHSSSLWHINLLSEYLAMFPDLRYAVAEDERINIPGTVQDANWSVRLRPTLDELVAHSGLKKAMRNVIC
jgi:4-alpha-glucanotransferase